MVNEQSLIHPNALSVLELLQDCEEKDQAALLLTICGYEVNDNRVVRVNGRPCAALYRHGVSYLYSAGVSDSVAFRDIRALLERE